MATFTVTTTDDTNDSGDGFTSLREAITFANSQAGQDTITFDASLAGLTVEVDSFLPVITDDLVIDGEGQDITISGGDVTRIFFVGGPTAGTDVTIRDLTLADGLADGGDSTNSARTTPGGGGLGAGGAVFVRSGASVELDDVSFEGNAASGGDSIGQVQTASTGSGGGGLGGNGASTASIGSSRGHGGGGAFADGQPGNASQGGAGGGPNGGAGGGTNSPGQPGGDLSGGGGAGTNADAGDGGFGGGGGGSTNAGQGGDGGFGGGGGGAINTSGGSGGFGGGGGASVSGSAGGGGFGGGNGGAWVGGGGAAFGGAVFVMEGASLTIAGAGSASTGSVTPGAGATALFFPAGGNGSAAGSFLFTQQGTVTFAPGAGKTITISDTIADDFGNTDANNDGTANDTSAGGGITINGATTGTVVLSAASSYHGATTVAEGTLQVDGSIANSAVTVQSGGTLKGTGAVGDVTVQSGGTLAPGNSPEIIDTNNFNLQSGATLQVEIGGTTVGTQYDQVNVTGTVTLGGTLDVSFLNSFNPTAGQTFTIINNDGSDAVNGTFASLGQNAEFAVGSESFRISYTGGSGNDVVLTSINSESPLVVTTLSDVVNANDGQTSLREAIAYANSHAGTDTITFDQSLAGNTLFLANGAGDFDITSNLTIDGDINGNGTPDITIDADSGLNLDNSDSRVFNISGTGTIDVTLNGLIIRNGYLEDFESGGGISVGQADRLTLSNSTVADNIAANNGGGIYGDNGSSITLQNSIVSGNYVAFNRGGGIYTGSNSSITLTNSTISGNHSSGDGGGLYAGAYSSVALTNSTVSGNGTGQDAGGIGGYVDTAITLTNSTVSGNSAGGSGGGIYGFSGGPITLVNSTVTGNSADDTGGGIYDYGDTVTLTNSIVAGNRGANGNDLFGGDSPSDLVLNGHNILGSAPSSFLAPSGSGSITTIDGASQAAMETVFDTVVANGGRFAGVLASNGGPVQTVALKPSVTNPAIDASDGSAPATDARGFATFDVPGVANGSGGSGRDLGAFEASETLSLVVTTLDDVVDVLDGLTSLREAIAFANSGDADGVNGAADTITFASGLTGTIRLTGGTLSVTDVLTIDGDLGGNGKPKITISGDASGNDTHVAGSTTITDIAASQTAGTLADNVQIIRTSASLTLDSLVLTGGTATGADIADARGGAVGAFNTASPGTAVSVTATATTFAGNSAVSAGGALHASGTVTLQNSTVSGNLSGSAVSGAGGGGVFASTVNLTNTTVSGNSAAGTLGNSATGRGGGIFGIAVTLDNATVTGNFATNDAGGVNGNNPALFTIRNSIITGNDAAGNDDISTTTANTRQGGNIIGTNVFDGNTDVGDTTLAAVFASVSSNPHTGILSGTLADNGGPVRTIAILQDGAAHNAGGNGVLPADTADLDRDGNSVERLPVDARGLQRVNDGTVDLGAFEFIKTPEHFNLAWRNANTGESRDWTFVNGAVASNLILTTNGAPGWKIVAADDFNRDGIADLVWHNSATGDTRMWLMDASGPASTLYLGSSLNGWQVAATGDFNADATSDLLWQNTQSGEARIWLMADGQLDSMVVFSGPPPQWSVSGAGDFNGDGVSDLLWRNASTGEFRSWSMNSNGRYAAVAVLPAIPASQKVAATGDFNGDGADDIIFHNTASGAIVEWLMADGGVATIKSLGTLAPDWKLSGAGDYDQNGTDDLLWHNSATGEAVEWAMTAGDHTASIAFGATPAGWQVSVNPATHADLLPLA